MRTYRQFVSVTASMFAALLSLSATSQARPISLDEAERAERTVARKSIEVNVKLAPLTQELVTAINFEATDMREFRARQQGVHSFLRGMGFQPDWSHQYYDVNYSAWYSAERDMTVVCITAYGSSSQHAAYQLSGKMTWNDYIAW